MAVTFKKLPLDESGELLPSEVFLPDPRNQVIISAPKSGKTETMVNQKNILIGDTQGGTDYFQARNSVNLLTYEGADPFKVTKDGTFVPMGLFQTVEELGKLNNMKKYWELYKAFSESRGEIRKKNYELLTEHIRAMKFPIFALDTVTDFQYMMHDAALADYNVYFKKSKDNIKRVDDYGGSQYIRRTILGNKSFIEKYAAPFIIYTGHIKEKKKILTKSQDSISVADMDLEGTLSTIFTQQSHANSIFYRTKDGCYLDYQKKDEETDFDSRPPHLANKKIKIADIHTFDKDGNKTKNGQTFWKEIYPTLEF